MTSEINYLAQLKDIHLPPPISWWPLSPLAYGWLFIGLMIGVFLCIQIKNRVINYLDKRYIIAEFEMLQKKYQCTPSTGYLAEAVVLLKRALMKKYPRSLIAPLTDEAWLVFLDTISKTDEFTKGIGKLLLVVPYQAISQPANELFPLLIKTVKRCI
jgi:hypothetical protein